MGAVECAAGGRAALEEARQRVDHQPRRTAHQRAVEPHELRTPLASIRVFGELLRLGKAETPEKVKMYGEYIETESRRLTQLINNILDLARIESGRKSYELAPADLEAVVRETLRTFRPSFEQAGFRLGWQPPAAPLPPIALDAGAIGQSLANLLDNAQKYSGDARDIDVALDREGDCAVVTVADHGLGIPRDEQAKIFDRFHRVSTGLVLDLFPDNDRLQKWMRGAAEKIAFQGLPARICWLGYGERDRAGLAFNDLVASGAVSAPIVIGRDHLDCGSVASPYRETESMLDGSDAIADWPLLNALLNTASGASWVSLHHGGGVGIGRSIHAGQVSVADGTALAAEKLARVLTNDPGMGVIRHVDAGYDEADVVAEARGVRVPMRE